MSLFSGAFLGGMAPRPRQPQSEVEYLDVAGWGGAPLRTYYYRPETWTPNWPAIVVIHGANRNLQFTLDTWLPLAQSIGFMPVIPHFTHRSFGGDKFALGGVRRGFPAERSAFRAIEPMFDALRAETGLRRTRYSLFGHSAGAQFVERFLLFNREARAARTVLSMAGWYTLPNERLPWPYGTHDVAIDEGDFASLFERECSLVLGENDDDPYADQLRRSSLAKSQGRHRLERGQHFFSVAREFARERSLPFNWAMRILPDAKHDSRAAARAYAAWLAHRQ
ncbi:hypothetical protein [Qipengyuania zhejiangensis]|uniref:hypothetical protein n=1 Tax=Qipengyuania zhejiangensis TaxID=3077782 RepID=UPI002D778606|nr:hypothetical protein [Qipengyuania sp. Z2]